MTDSKMEEKATALEERKQNQPRSPGTEIVSLTWMPHTTAKAG